MAETPPGTERNNCHCELSRPFMGRIKVNEKLYSSSPPLSKRNAGEQTTQGKRGGSKAARLCRREEKATCRLGKAAGGGGGGEPHPSAAQEGSAAWTSPTPSEFPRWLLPLLPAAPFPGPLESRMGEGTGFLLNSSKYSPILRELPGAPSILIGHSTPVSRQAAGLGKGRGTEDFCEGQARPLHH